jgi:hypothetical protein
MSTEQNYHYAILQETSGEECESWLYFIRYEGNEEALRHLKSQLESIEWYIIDDISTFDIDLDHLVSETTAKEMIRIELNSVTFHRKFNGKLQMIDFKLKQSAKNEKKMSKVFDMLGYGHIDEYISDEEIDPENICIDSEDEDVSDKSSEEESESSSEDEKTPQKLITEKLPGTLKLKKTRR